MSSIRSIHNALTSLAQDQSEAVDALATALQTVRRDEGDARKTVQASAQALVVTGDDARYAALTRAAKAAGAPYDFTAQVKAWTDQDAANRTERAELETKWGTRQQVADKAKGIKEEIDLVQSALNDIRPEIKQFDETTQHIKEHNEKYKDKPKAQINETTENDFKQFKWGRFLLWLTFINRGPQKAYKIVHEYSKKYGDYYEDSRNIAKMRQNEQKLTSDTATKQASYDETLGAGQRMSQLDNSYRGPEGMAAEIRTTVEGLILKTPAFAQPLIDEVPSQAAKDAAVGAAKIRNLQKAESVLVTEQQQAQNTLASITDAQEYLSQAVGRVGNETVYFDMDGIETRVSREIRVSKETARSATAVAESIEEYQAPASATLQDVERGLKSGAQVDDNRLVLDFTGLKSSVSSAVDAYEREQERLREIREAEERAARQAAAAAAAILMQQQQRQQDTSSVFNGNSSRRDDNIDYGNRGVTPSRDDSDDISNGSTGVSASRDDSDDISQGSSGVADTRDNDNISSGNDGISP